jgi:Lipocalin-like domain
MSETRLRPRGYTALAASLLICMTYGDVTAQDQSTRFIGVWKVRQGGFYAPNADGTRTYPFGEHAVGRVILTASGYAANQFQAVGRQACATGTSPVNCTSDEATAAFKSGVAYQYRYTVEPDPGNPLKGKIIWLVDLVMYPNWQGQRLVREYEMNPDGRSWTLIAPFPRDPSRAVKVELERVDNYSKNAELGMQPTTFGRG